MTTRAGFIAIVGAPNAGKSTLLNTLVGGHVAIVSPKVQTTRVNVRGIVTQENTQFIFVDTPGLHRPKGKMDKAMVAAAHEAHTDADAVLVLVDAAAGFSERVSDMLEALKEHARAPLLLAFNKVDKLGNKEKLLPLMAQAQQMAMFREVFAISALQGSGAQDVLKRLAAYLPESPFLYDPDILTDAPTPQLAAETTREKLFHLLHEEVPYDVYVETVSMQERPEKQDVVIHQNIVVARDGQKKIVVGKGGDLLKKVGESSRKQLQELFDKKVHLFLKVRVREGWQEQDGTLREIGLTPQPKDK